MDAGFLNVVEIGQYFMTKNTEEFPQYRAAACREYTLPTDENSSGPKGWNRGNTKIAPILEVTTFCLQSEYGVEIRIEYMNKEKHFSLVNQNFSWLEKIGHEPEQQVLRRQTRQETFTTKTEAFAFASRSNSKAKQEDLQLIAYLQKLYVFVKKCGLTLSQKNYVYRLPTSACEFKVHGLLLSWGVFQNDPVHLVCPRPGNTVAANGTHEWCPPPTGRR